MTLWKRDKRLHITRWVWCCEVCGRRYTEDSAQGLEWYDGYRCDGSTEETGVLCGGVVSLRKETNYAAQG